MKKNFMFIVYNSEMELANVDSGGKTRKIPPFSPSKNAVRPAQKEDFPQIQELLSAALYRHIHADWYSIEFWLNETPCWVTVRAGQLVGLLAAAADPPPAAWVRLAAVADLENGPHSERTTLESLLAVVVDQCQSEGVESLHWMSHRRWADRWLPSFGFEQITAVITFRKLDLALPELPPPAPGLVIRPALPEDMPLLAKIEEDAFAPLWRHSSRALHLAARQALSFDVALLEGRPVGFQHSTPAAQNGAHLARITVLPDWQEHGIGTTLLRHAFDGYAKKGCTHVSLNTQEDNLNAQKLYRKLGFRESTYRWPLWRFTIR